MTCEHIQNLLSCHPEQENNQGWEGQYFGSGFIVSGPGSSILAKYHTIPDPDPEFTSLIPKASIKDAQTTGDAFSPQKRISSTSFVGHF
jgi:hypothetical protein